jgi:cell division protein FtsW
MIAVRSYDRWLLFTMLALVFLGALMVYSSTSVITPSLERKHITEFFYLKKHIFTIAIGFVAMWLAYLLNSETIKRLSVPLLILSLILLMLVFVPGIGVTAGGATRWLRLWPSTFQPSELVKLAMVMYLAWFLSSDGFKAAVAQPVTRKNGSRKVDPQFMYFLMPVTVMVVFQGIFLLQPDFGAAISLGALTVGLLFISGVKLRYLFSLLLLCIPAIVMLLMSPYRLRRVITFLDPWQYRHDSGFQLVQSFIAFGSGGLKGMGLGKSRQKLDFLPEVHTDFIYSMVGEELGFIAAVLVLLLFALLFIRGLMVSGRWKQGSFEFYMAFGLSFMIAMQALVNVAVVTGLLPTKGLPLPFISYGGSSMLVNMVAVGLLLNYSRAAQRNESYIPVKYDKFMDVIEKKKAKHAKYGRNI